MIFKWVCGVVRPLFLKEKVFQPQKNRVTKIGRGNRVTGVQKQLTTISSAQTLELKTQSKLFRRKLFHHYKGYKTRTSLTGENPRGPVQLFIYNSHSQTASCFRKLKHFAETKCSLCKKLAKTAKNF